MKIEKQPGPDWLITVRIEGEALPLTVSIFGAGTRAAAELEARRSFMPDQAITVLSVRRVSLD